MATVIVLPLVPDPSLFYRCHSWHSRNTCHDCHSWKCIADGNCDCVAPRTWSVTFLSLATFCQNILLTPLIYSRRLRKIKRESTDFCTICPQQINIFAGSVVWLVCLLAEDSLEISFVLFPQYRMNPCSQFSLHSNQPFFSTASGALVVVVVWDRSNPIRCS